MSLTYDWHKNIVQYIQYQLNRPRQIVFGGGAGANGGTGTPAGGASGQLAQSYICYDTTEAATAGSTATGGSSPSLVHNLNRIRGGWSIGDDAINERHMYWKTAADEGTSGCIGPEHIPYFTTGCLDATNVRDAILEAYMNTPVPLTILRETTETATIQDALNVRHAAHPGLPAALFGVRQTFGLEDDSGAMQSVSELVSMWADPSAGAESPLLRGTTYPAGSAGPGYFGFWTWNDVNTTARTIIPNGAGDVTQGIAIMYLVKQSSIADPAFGVTGCKRTASVDLWNSGGYILTVTANSDGSVTIQATGAHTYDVSLLLAWV